MGRTARNFLLQISIIEDPVLLSLIGRKKVRKAEQPALGHTAFNTHLRYT